MAGDKTSAELSLSLEVSDDEMPEEVTFETARNEALRRVKSVLDTAKRQKEQLKEKRRKRQELFKEQKKRRLLPTDVLDEIEVASLKTQEESEDGDKEKPEEMEETLTHSRILMGTYTVSTAKERVSFQQQVAKDFLHSRRYGPQSQRTTNNELLSLQNKKGTNKQAAVEFFKKNWASKEKAKAEKLKQRWIHKQHIFL